MKKALLITGEKASEVVHQQKNLLNDFYENKIAFEVKELPVDVAAFITSEMVESLSLEDYDYVIAPGNSSDDFSRLSNVYKGPKNAFDIFRYLKKSIKKLSPTKSAEKMIKVKRNDKKMFEEFRDQAIPQIKIKDLEIGKEMPMRVAAEIVDSTDRSKEEIRKKITQYEKQGADIIDLGVPISAKKDDLIKTIKIAKEETDLPISVDTTNSDFIKTSIELNVDLILSITPKNIDELLEHLDGVNCVVAARENLENLVEKTKKVGAKPIADPILDPPHEGLVESLARYHDFQKKNLGTPIFFGVGNVTEMIDADSIGVNAIMASIASELSASVLFTAQASSKTRNSIRELKEASKLNFLAKNKNTAPKDFGYNLLRLKEKERKEIEPEFGEEVIRGKEDEDYEMDRGFFEIGVNRENEEIIASFYPNKNEQPSLTIRGDTAKAVSDVIKKKHLIEKDNHLFYMGRELKKAEIALKTGKNYIQGGNLF